MNRQGGSILLVLVGALLLAAPPLIQEVRLGENRRVLQEWNSSVVASAGASEAPLIEALREDGRLIRRGPDRAEAPAGVVEPIATLPPLAAPAAERGPTSNGLGAGFRIQVPSLGLDWAVMADIGNAELAHGPGHYPGTALPGAGGNLAVAGHRTHRGEPSYFYALGRLEPGEAVLIQQGEQTWRYEVEQRYITTAYDLSVLAPTTEPTLTLTTCDPPGTEDLRLIIRARLLPDL